jgi:hypothetical protein
MIWSNQLYKGDLKSLPFKYYYITRVLKVHGKPELMKLRIVPFSTLVFKTKAECPDWWNNRLDFYETTILAKEFENIFTPTSIDEATDSEIRN